MEKTNHALRQGCNCKKLTGTIRNEDPYYFHFCTDYPFKQLFVKGHMLFNNVPVDGHLDKFVSELTKTGIIISDSGYITIVVREMNNEIRKRETEEENKKEII